MKYFNMYFAGSEDLSFAVKSLEDLRREKLEQAKKLVGESSQCASGSPDCL